MICNHQRSVSKTHGVQISRLNEKIEELKVNFIHLYLMCCIDGRLISFVGKESISRKDQVYFYFSDYCGWLGTREEGKEKNTKE